MSLLGKEVPLCVPTARTHIAGCSVGEPAGTQSGPNSAFKTHGLSLKGVLCPVEEDNTESLLRTGSWSVQ